MIKKLLIANRGEIALRVQHTAKKMGIATVAVYSSADEESAFVKQAHQAVLLPGTQLSETYLNIEAVITAALETGADAIHPGYGFLSENAAFVEACIKAGITFIGPSAEAMRSMGNKIAARDCATNAGVPVTPGITGTTEELLKSYGHIGFPVLIKAAAGGGGKGMRVVENEGDFQLALEATAREAKNYFGDSTVYIEKYIAKPRHIEVQVLGDQQGKLLHLYERECSLQRRHQKIIEEAPSPTLSNEVRKRICAAAVALAKSIGYHSAGTMEFLVDESLNFYFLEMNTRIQVEHPVTELTTGIDIVEQQIMIANGEPLPFEQTDIIQRGHAIECRIYAEDPAQRFLPSPGVLKYYQEPSFEVNPFLSNAEILRIDGMQLQTGDTISGDFDPMISKVIVWAPNREEAGKAMLSALQQYAIKGIQTNIEFLSGLLQHPDYINNNISTKYIDQNLETITEQIQQKKKQVDITIPLTAALAKSLAANQDQALNIWQVIGYWRHSPVMNVMVDGDTLAIDIIQTSPLVFVYKDQQYRAETRHINGIHYSLLLDRVPHLVGIYEKRTGCYEITFNGMTHTVVRPDMSYVDGEVFEAYSGTGGKAGNITSPMPGKVIKLHVKAGDVVKRGDPLLVVEAMKMENNIVSTKDAAIEKVLVKEGDKVDTTMTLVEFSE
ncbi:biotin carboxylase N-terminal domain-containing protein [Niabella yanshanensis]|uniref:Biotin carboxylase N-terminal domain-containing protein n=1 Tax=Niabella yanshanensis TaxID=577386 RepID=A0ABZ0WBA2_9BACT|nr:biotin carboxylase N-terminal domain-containing protein [Niabella yanshanensis]WQD39764.1 biotin carboxylase N-terminal domain-containing protein [Niabella yanshanensis]